jgi:hypothetical protein
MQLELPARNFLVTSSVCKYFVLRWMARNLQTLMVKVENDCTHLCISNHKKENPSWEANTSSASQEILRILWNSNVHYYIHNPPPPSPLPSQINPVQASPTNFFSIHFHIIPTFTSMTSKWSLPSGPPTKTPYAYLLSPIRATCRAHLILLDFSPEQNLVRSTHHKVPRYVVLSTTPRTSSFLGQISALASYSRISSAYKGTV